MADMNRATDSPTLDWGILGTGEIARAFAEGLAGSKTGRLVAVGSRTREAAEAFGDKYAVPRRHGSYEALLADPQVGAVYISTPHPLHEEWAVKAADAKKHILCEKPIGVNAAEAAAMIAAARRNDVFLMEAFMYRCHPQTHKLVELLRQNVIGEVRAIQASFSFHHPIPFDPNSRLLSNALAGGGILDVGCYPVSFARLVAGVAAGKDFADPDEVNGAAHLGRTGVDEWAAATLKFPGGIVAQVATGVQVEQEVAARVYGSDGWIHLPTPWVPARDGGESKILVHRRVGKTPEEVVVRTDQQIYGIEADTVAAHVSRRQAPSPAMSWDDTLGNMKTLDRWREAVGLVYDFERPGSPE